MAKYGTACRYKFPRIFHASCERRRPFLQKRILLLVQCVHGRRRIVYGLMAGPKEIFESIGAFFKLVNHIA